MAEPPVVPLAGEAHASRGLSLLLGAIGVAAAVLGWHGLIGQIAPDPTWPSTAARLGSASVALIPAAAVLWLMLATQMAVRMALGAFEPAHQPDGPFLRTNQRAITNTLEQMLIFVPSLLALATGVPATRMPEVLALALTFAAARLVFWLGYLARPMLRAPGMAASFACSTAALGAAIWAWLA